MRRALTTLEEIRSLVIAGETDGARGRQDDFIQEYDDELTRISATLRVLSDRGSELIRSL